MAYRINRRPGINPIWILIGVNVVILIATYINRGIIYERFGLTQYNLSSQPWTLLTYMFLHADYFHLLMNMLTLYFFGTFVIALVGETHFLTTYFIGGIMGGLFFVLLAPHAFVVGASGAVFALGGLLAMMRPNVKVISFPIPIPMPLWVAILLGFVIVLVPTLGANIAWQAHLGGLVYGLAIGYYFRRREQRH
jgi:membrane associated rhomboid family serine protease